MDTNKMRDLKAMAEAAGSDEWYAAGDLRYCDDKTGEIHGLHHDDSRFIAAASPAAVLALLAEIERLSDENDKAWRHAHNDKNNVQALTSEASRLQAERDQLKAENEAIRKVVAGKVVCDLDLFEDLRDSAASEADEHRQHMAAYRPQRQEVLDWTVKRCDLLLAAAKEASHG